MGKKIYVEQPTTPFRRRLAIRDRLQAEDPEHFYYWARDDGENPVFLEETQNFEIVTTDDKKAGFLKSQKVGEPGVDNAIRIKGAILMRCPMHERVERLAARERKALERMDAPKRAFMAKADIPGKTEGIDTSRRSQGNIHDALERDHSMPENVGRELLQHREGV